MQSKVVPEESHVLWRCPQLENRDVLFIILYVFLRKKVGKSIVYLHIGYEKPNLSLRTIQV